MDGKKTAPPFWNIVGGGAWGKRAQRRCWSLKDGTFLFDDFLNLLLTVPDLGITLQIHHLQIDLVENRLGPLCLIEDRRDGTFHHEICADFLARRFMRILSCIHGLLFSLGAQFVTISLSCHKGDLLRVRQLPFKVSHKCVHVDMFMAAVQDGPDDYHWLAVGRAGEIVEPRILQRLFDHRLCDHPGIGIVPAAAQICDDFGINPRYSCLLGTAGQHHYRQCDKPDSSSVHHNHAIPPRKCSDWQSISQSLYRGARLSSSFSSRSKSLSAFRLT